MSYESYLEHHGVLGMKWGVHRYQNADGSYTKTGLDHYRKFESKYNESKKAYKDVKERYKTGNATKADVNSAKSELKNSKKNLSRSYDQLKKDHAADKGKELYSNGKTIIGNADKQRTIAALAIGSRVVANSLANNGYIETAVAVNHVSNGLALTASLMYVNGKIQAHYLRSYYGHSRPKDL